MRFVPGSRFLKALAAALLVTLLLLIGIAVLSPAFGRGHAAAVPAKVTVNYPAEGSLFPPEITPPTFLWTDPSDARHWTVEISFADHTAPVRLAVAGQHFTRGAIDQETGSDGGLLDLTPEQKAMRAWKPDAELWTKIKQHSVKAPATIIVTGFADEALQQPVSSGSTTLSTSTDPVGAPIFYRDVPLMLPPRSEKGSIAPLPPFAIPLIRWKLRNIADPESKTVMQNLATCANCHSFSRDGKTMGLDLDGPKNDRGLYAIAPVTKDVTITNKNVIRWSSFLEKPEQRSSEPAVKRFGFMSQISPDGRYVVTSIGPPGLAETHKDELPEFAPGIADRLFSVNYSGPPFNQVFYPTRGILAVYDRVEGKLRPLPGADDPKYVQTSAFWSPDGKYLIYSRAEARDPYPPGSEKPEYANDPRETQIQYDLYKIAFNEGRGGKAEPVEGASNNGMSNNFPKVSPDGRWIVFVQNRNGLLMRPDSKLYIVPFNGGKARLMNCNLPLMNSWHTFSPNGRWLAFSSKGRSPYTQLMLTHIDANGNDTPAILVDNMTAANRAVNIPEFVNLPPDGLEKIDPQATEFYRLFNQAYDLMENRQMGEAAKVIGEAVARDPNDALAHYVLATALSQNGQEQEAVAEYRKACELDTHHSAWYDHYAVALANTGNPQGAIAAWNNALEIDARDAGAEADMGTVLFETGHAEEGAAHLKKAIQIAPKFAEAHNRLGWGLAQNGLYAEALDELQTAVDLQPNAVEFRVNLGYVLGISGDYAGALAAFQKAVEISAGKDWRSLDMLATAYYKVGRVSDAVATEQKALDLARQQNNQQLVQNLQKNLARFSGSETSPQAH